MSDNSSGITSTMQPGGVEINLARKPVDTIKSISGERQSPSEDCAGRHKSEPHAESQLVALLAKNLETKADVERFLDKLKEKNPAISVTKQVKGERKSREILLQDIADALVGEKGTAKQALDWLMQKKILFRKDVQAFAKALNMKGTDKMNVQDLVSKIFEGNSSSLHDEASAQIIVSKREEKNRDDVQTIEKNVVIQSEATVYNDERFTNQHLTSVLMNSWESRADVERFLDQLKEKDTAISVTKQIRGERKSKQTLVQDITNALVEDKGTAKQALDWLIQKKGITKKELQNAARNMNIKVTDRMTIQDIVNKVVAADDMKAMFSNTSEEGQDRKRVRCELSRLSALSPDTMLKKPRGPGLQTAGEAQTTSFEAPTDTVDDSSEEEAGDAHCVLVNFSVGELEPKMYDTLKSLAKSLTGVIYHSKVDLGFPDFSGKDWSDSCSDYTKLGRVFMPHILKFLSDRPCNVVDILECVQLGKLWGVFAKSIRVLTQIFGHKDGYQIQDENKGEEMGKNFLLTACKSNDPNFQARLQALMKVSKIPVMDFYQCDNIQSLMSRLEQKESLIYCLRLRNKSDEVNSTEFQRNVDGFILIFTDSVDVRLLIERKAAMQKEIENQETNILPVTVQTFAPTNESDWDQIPLRSDSIDSEAQFVDLLSNLPHLISESLAISPANGGSGTNGRPGFDIDAAEFFCVELDGTKMNPELNIANADSLNALKALMCFGQIDKRARLVVLRARLEHANDVESDNQLDDNVWEMDPDKIGVFPEQHNIAKRILCRVRYALAQKSRSLDSFKDLKFVILVPTFMSLRDQTLQRVKNFYAKAENSVFMYSNSSECLWKSFRNQIVADQKQEILFVVIADESHWGVNVKGWHDSWLNDRDNNGTMLSASNLVILMVSATPFNNLTQQSRIPTKFVKIWKKDSGHEDAGDVADAEPAEVCDVRDLTAHEKHSLSELNVVEWYPKGQRITRSRYVRFEDYLRTIRSEKRHDAIGISKSCWQRDKIRADDYLHGLLEAIGNEKLETKKQPFAKVDVLIADYMLSLTYFCHVSSLAPEERDIRRCVQDFIDLIHPLCNTQQVLEAIADIVADDDEEAQPMEESLRAFLEMKGKNDDNNYITETDRIVQDLFRQDPVTGAGSMKVIRVNRHEEAKRMVEKIQACRDKLFPGKFPFAVLMDDGRLPLQQSIEEQFLLRPFVNAIQDQKTLKGLKIYRNKKKEQLQFEDLDYLPCLLVLVDKGRMGDTFPQSMDCLDLRLRASDNTMTLIQELGRLCRYPRFTKERSHSFSSEKGSGVDEVLDRAFCSAKELAIFDSNEQFLGYCTHRADFESSSSIEIFCEGKLMRHGKTNDVFIKAEKTLKMKVEGPTADDPLCECFALGIEHIQFSEPCKVTVISKKIVSPTEEEWLLQITNDDDTEISRAVEKIRAKPSCYLCRDTSSFDHFARRCGLKGGIIRCLTDTIPYALLPKQIYISLQSAVKASDINDSRPRAEIWRCIKMATLDRFMKSTGFRRSGNQNFEKEHAYREYWTANSQGNGTIHGDSDWPQRSEPKTHDLRFLLFAECQIGKTGTYIAFLQQLRRLINHGNVSVKPILTSQEVVSCDVGCVPSCAQWTYPYWLDIGKMTTHTYSGVKQGKYHKMFARFRFLALLEACRVPGVHSRGFSDNWLMDYRERIVKDESIMTKGSLELLNRTIERLLELEVRHNIPKPPLEVFDSNEFGNFLTDEKSCTAVVSAINWDGRLEPAHLIFSDQGLLPFDHLDNGRLVLRSGPNTWSKFFNSKPVDSMTEFSEANQTHEEDAIYLCPGECRHVLEEKQHAIHFPTNNEGRGVDKCARICCGIDAQVWKSCESAETTFSSDSIEKIRISIPTIFIENQWAKLAGSPNDPKLINLKAHAGDFYWIFNPTSGRSKIALLNYSQSLADYSFGQIFVVKSQEFEDYVKQWCAYPHAMIISLPSEMNIKSMGTCYAENSGIGFSRRFIQIFSYIFNIDYAWLLDDNIKETREMCMEQIRKYQRHDKTRPPTVCEMFKPMLHVQHIVRGEICKDVSSDSDSLADLGRESEGWLWYASPKPGDGAWKDFRNPSEDLKRTDPVSAQSLSEYVGHSSKIAVIGMHRCWQEWMRLKQPFSKTHSVYSFFLLNVRATVEAKILYPPKPAWEDIDFAFELFDQGLEVVKVNRWFHSKVNFQQGVVKDKEASSGIKIKDCPLFVWPSTEEVCLKILSNEVTGNQDWVKLQMFLDCYIQSSINSIALVGIRPSWEKLRQSLAGVDSSWFDSFKKMEPYEFERIVLLYPQLNLDEDEEDDSLVSVIQKGLDRIKKGTSGWTQDKLREILLIIPLDAALKTASTKSNEIKACLDQFADKFRLCEIMTSTAPPEEHMSEHPRSIKVSTCRMNLESSKKGKEKYILLKLAVITK